MKKIAAFVFEMFISLSWISAQSSAPIVTLAQSIESVLANGNDYKILQANLAVSTAQYALSVSKNSLTLGGSLGYNQSFILGDSALLSGNPIASIGGSQPSGPLAGLALSGPMTSVGLSGYPWIPPTGGGDTTSSIGLTLSQTLWNGYPGGVARATVDKSLLSLQGVQLSTESGRLALIYNVKQAYYTMLAAQQGLVSKKEILDKQNAVLKQLSSLYDQKLASLVDLKSAQLNVESAQIDLDGTQYALRAARRALANLMGRPSGDDFTAAEAEDPTVPVTPLDAAVSEGLNRRVEIKQIALALKSSNIDLAVAKGQATPTVSVSGGINWLFDWKGTGAGEANAGVKLAMPILDAGGVKNQVDAIEKQNEVYAAQADQLMKNITAGIQSAWEGVELAKEKLDYANRAAETTNLQFQIVGAQRDIGTASNQDLLTAAVNAANALTALEAAKSAAQLAVLQLQNVMGYVEN